MKRDFGTADACREELFKASHITCTCT
jgi:hypothetical protein